MKKLLCLLIILCNLFCSKAQKYDNYWIYGADPSFQNQPWFGNGYVEFINNTIVAGDRNRNVAMWHCQQTICDAEGNLEFYTNGMWVQDTSGQKIENGDSLNFGWAWQYWYNAATNGSGAYSVPEAVFALPKPNNDSSFVLIQQEWGDVFSLQDGLGKVLFSTLVKEDDHWKITNKNTLLQPLYYPVYRDIAACKHGNGRDWWILFTEENTNCIIKFLLTPDTLIFADRQCIGDTILNGFGTKAVFSPDGTKYAFCATALHGINMLDFDRCNGILSNFINIPAPLVIDSVNGQLQIVDFNWASQFSSNNRFFYVVLASRIYQYDLLSSDILGTRDSILNDNFLDTITFNNWTFYTAQTGPDGVIYLGPSSSGRFLSTINNPNGKGDSCDFRMRNVPLTKSWYVGMPYYPNYRLGRLLESACDTVYNSIHPIYTQAPWLKVYPNPASDMVRFDYNWVEWESIADCELRIADLNGRIVMQHKVPKYSSRQDVSVKGLASGLYTVSLQSGERQIAVSKLTKQ